MPVKSYHVSCMLMIHNLHNQEDFPKINRSTSINVELENLSKWLKLNKLTLNVEKKLNV